MYTFLLPLFVLHYYPSSSSSFVCWPGIFRLRWQTNMNACVLLMKMQNLNWVQVNRNQQEERRRFAIANMKKWLQITIISSQSILNNEYKYMHTCHLVISFTKQCYHLHHKIISIPAPGLTPNAINPFLLFLQFNYFLCNFLHPPTIPVHCSHWSFIKLQCRLIVIVNPTVPIVIPIRFPVFKVINSYFLERHPILPLSSWVTITNPTWCIFQKSHLFCLTWLLGIHHFLKRKYQKNDCTNLMSKQSHIIRARAVKFPKQ